MQLIINQAGSRLRRKKATFELKKQEKTYKLSPEKIKSILIAEGVSISSDAILLAVEHQIDLLILDKSGQPLVRLWSPGFGSISKIRRKQAFFSRSLEASKWIGRILLKRLNHMQNHLKYLKEKEVLQHTEIKQASPIEKSRLKIENWLKKQEKLQTEVANRIRGWEGSAARYYFAELSALLPKTYQFSRRSRRPAKDIFNCLLNYAYGILYGRIEIALIRAGVDPYLGVFHQDIYNRPVLVYDCIEAYRHWAEELVCSLCQEKIIQEDMFDLEEKGHWLNERGRILLISRFNEFLAESPIQEGAKYSRAHLIDRDAQQLAQKLLNFQENPF